MIPPVFLLFFFTLSFRPAKLLMNVSHGNKHHWKLGWKTHFKKAPKKLSLWNHPHLWDIDIHSCPPKIWVDFFFSLAYFVKLTLHDWLTSSHSEHFTQSVGLFFRIFHWLVVSTPSKYIGRIGSNWIISPSRVENKKYLEPPPSSPPTSHLLWSCLRNPSLPQNKIITASNQPSPAHGKNLGEFNSNHKFHNEWGPIITWTFLQYRQLRSRTCNKDYGY